MWVVKIPGIPAKWITRELTVTFDYGQAEVYTDRDIARMVAIAKSGEVKAKWNT